jgi:nucleotide-binding universal stress UspA family protein
MTPITRILVPFDFSVHASKALSHAIDLAQHYDADVMLLHVFQTESYVLPQRHVLPGPEALEQISAELDSKLAGVANDVLATGVRVESIVRRGVAATAILATARETKSDLIVMGTHGHTGAKHLWFGSVAENVVRPALCPVLTVRAVLETQSSGTG